MAVTWSRRSVCLVAVVAVLSCGQPKSPIVIPEDAQLALDASDRMGKERSKEDGRVGGDSAPVDVNRPADIGCIPICIDLQCGDDGCGGSCGQCDDGLLCTVDSCHEGHCLFELQGFFCAIAVECVPAGAPQPDNPCQVCTPTLATGAWSPAQDGAGCGPGSVCHEGECCDYMANCQGRDCGDDGCGGSCGACPGAYDCGLGEDDGLCLADCGALCAGLDCGTAGLDDECQCGTCDDGDLCTDDICTVEHTCIFAANNAACDDGNPCTEDDSCNGGVCSGTLIPTVDLEIGQCLCEGNDDCEPLDNGDVCDGTLVCAPSPEDEGLLVCQVEPGTVPKPCDDGIDCTADGCDPALGCQYVPDDGKCDDGNLCTDDLCDWVEGCIHTANLEPCDDGLFCTADQCVDGGCVSTLQPFYCLIIEQCVPVGAANPAEQCQECNPQTGLTAWTLLPDGTSCGDGKTCLGGSCCDPGENCVGKECGDNGCGGSCGNCGGEFDDCVDGSCVCQQQCDGLECGDDGCGGDCGPCPPNAPVCYEGKCGVVCEVDCEGKECGDDGCGGTCGKCPAWLPICTGGVCEPCPPACEDKECGPDGCGGSCGSCPPDKPDCLDGECVFLCFPKCSGKGCGSDGCGGACGICDGANHEVCNKYGKCLCDADAGYHLSADGKTCTTDPCDPTPCDLENHEVCDEGSCSCDEAGGYHLSSDGWTCTDDFCDPDPCEWDDGEVCDEGICKQCQKVSGKVTGEPKWDGANGACYLVTGDVIVPGGVTLVIGAGASVFFEGCYEIRIEGVLKADGTNGQISIIDLENCSWPLYAEVPQLLFNGTLAFSELKHVRIGHRQGPEGRRAIQIGTSWLQGPDGKLTVQFLEVESMKIALVSLDSALEISESILDGVTVLSSGAKVKLNESTFLDSSVGAWTGIASFSFSGCDIQDSKIARVKHLGDCRAIESTVQLGNEYDVTVLDSEFSSTSLHRGSYWQPYNVLIERCIFHESSLEFQGVESGSLLTLKESVLAHPVSSDLPVIDTGASLKTDRVAFIGEGDEVAIHAEYIALKNTLISSANVGIILGAVALVPTKNVNFDRIGEYAVKYLGDEVALPGVWWGTGDENNIAEKIFDYWDNDNYGKVDFSGYLTKPSTMAPIAPPAQVTKSEVAGGVQLEWLPNLVVDTAGYKVYWGEPTGYSFANEIDVGEVTTFLLEGVALDEVIAVTAYDSGADGTDDQIEGHESWFSEAVE